MARQPSGASRRLTKEAILDRVIPLFADSGYAAVSMRDLAKVCGITPAALYHHFADKESLYLEAVRYAFKPQVDSVEDLTRGGDSLRVHVRRFIDRAIELVSNDDVFRRLLVRELLDGNEPRIRMLSDQVFRDPFQRVAKFVRELLPSYDPNLLAVSMLSLVLGHYELAPIRRTISDESPSGDESTTIADHIERLVMNGLNEAEQLATGAKRGAGGGKTAAA